MASNLKRKTLNPQLSPQARQLFKTPPQVHNEGTNCWRISKHLAKCITASLRPEMQTLETGCGLSTLLFAESALGHTCIVPEQAEVLALQDYALKHEISLSSVSFVIEQSQRALPDLGSRLSKANFDFILIDGCHAFPTPFIDWYYLEPLLRIGGTLVVDDTQIWTGRVLRDFLAKDPAWELCEERTADFAAFRKLAEGSTNRGWNEQNYVAKRSWGPIRARIAGLLG